MQAGARRGNRAGILSAAAALLAVAAFSSPIVLWKETFSSEVKDGGKVLPKGWELKTKLGTAASEFYLAKDEKTGITFLHMESDKSSASVVCSPEKVNIRETPVIRWKWRANKLPEGGDGRPGGKDDQAIGIYVGTGSLLSKKSVSYRWDTDTPKGAEGNCSYLGGSLKIKWFTLRNKEDKTGEWFVEERNVAEDFNKAWGYYPEEIYVSVSCNSQYTGTKSSADLGWIEMVPVPAGDEK